MTPRPGVLGDVSESSDMLAQSNLLAALIPYVAVITRNRG